MLLNILSYNYSLVKAIKAALLSKPYLQYNANMVLDILVLNAPF